MEKLTKYNQAFLAYWIPVIEVLKELGGSGRPSEVADLVVEKMQIPDKIVAETIKSGPSRVKNQIAWARMYLVKNGFLDSSVRGVWSLTEKGLKSNLTAEEVQQLFYQKNKSRSKKKMNKSDKDNSSKNDEQEIIESIDYQTELLNTLQGLPPDGFERLCQRLLRESGFEQVRVTGKSGMAALMELVYCKLILLLVLTFCFSVKGIKALYHLLRYGILEGQCWEGQTKV